MEVTATKGQIIKGKPVADQISENLIKEVDELVKEGINPKLAIVRVGARGDDLAYERGALKRCQTIGIETEVVELAEDITQEDYEKTLRSLNENKEYIRQSEYTFKLEERNRLSQEIHDKIGHSMTGALIQMEAAKRLNCSETEEGR